jgi:glycosyltransferase involved in cell wall biosynthesis
MNAVSISTITPVYAGKKSISELISRIEQVRNSWKASELPLELGEAIFVNDGSSDGSLELLYEIQKTRPWIKVINMSRNFGQHQATVAGILHSSGDWIVTLDEDLQHDPIFIDEMMEHAVTSELDIVYAKPQNSVHESPLRDWTSRFFKSLVSYIASNPYVRIFNSFRLVRGSIARASGSVCSHGTYFDIALCWFTENISVINLPLKDIRYVEEGKSGYTMRKLISHSRRLVVSSDAKVLRLGGAIGIISLLFSVLLGFNIFFNKIAHPETIQVQGWTSLFLAILFYGGLVVVMLGIILEFVSVILLHIQGKPTYFTVDRLSDRILLEYYKGRKKDDRFPESAPTG